MPGLTQYIHSAINQNDAVKEAAKHQTHVQRPRLVQLVASIETEYNSVELDVVHSSFSEMSADQSSSSVIRPPMLSMLWQILLLTESCLMSFVKSYRCYWGSSGYF